MAASSISCGSPERPKQPPGDLTIAAASNLMEAFAEIGAEFTRQTQVPVRFTYGATTQLAQQIESGAPFDAFAAADTEHIDGLIASKRIIEGSRIVYARGRLALWSPRGEPPDWADLTSPATRFIAIAQPSSAPYGQAAVDALRKLGLWEKVEAKVVYANNIQMAKQFAASGNAEVAFTAWSLVAKEKGARKLDATLHRPLDQAMGIVKGAAREREAERFAEFLRSARGRKLLESYGYETR